MPAKTTQTDRPVLGEGDRLYNRKPEVKTADRARWGDHRYSPEEFVDRVLKAHMLNRSERNMLLRTAAILLDPARQKVGLVELRQLHAFGYAHPGADPDTFGTADYTPLGAATARLLATHIRRQQRQRKKEGEKV